MKKIYLIAESGRPKEFLDKWRQEFLAGMAAYQDFGKRLGAKNAIGFPFERPDGFSFSQGRQPEGWIRPQSKGFSRPKQNNITDRNRLAEIPFPDHPEAILVEKFGLASSASFKRGDFSTSQALGGFRPFSFCWSLKGDGTLDDVIVEAPDYQAFLKDPEITDLKWGPEGAGPVIPEGFRQVTEAEVDLIFAEDKRRREIYAETNSEIALMCDAHTPADLFRSMQSAMAQFGRSLIIDFDCDDEGMDISMSYEGSHLKVHPALEAAARRIAPQLVKCNAEDWDETTESSGRILWRHGEDPFLDMDDQVNDWSHESYIETDLLVDMEFEEPAVGAFAAPE
ncbi:hypothetical protein KUV57_11225 [Epibacterium sp. DP7N7-1]|nr:hypothetical protein [Epibacterium sp. DP7N7-1]